MKHKSTRFASVGLSLVLAACGRIVPNTLTQRITPCSLYETKEAVQLKFQGIKPLLKDFEQSKHPYDAVVVRTKGGSPLLYWRMQLVDQCILFCKGDEQKAPNYEQRPGYHNAVQLFDGIPFGHYFGGPQSYLTSETSVESVIIKKDGNTIFSYSIDRDCMENLPVRDTEKIARAKALIAYITKRN
jgi:hypothetical protein